MGSFSFFNFLFMWGGFDRCFGCFTMDVIASVAFATQVDSQINTDDPFVRHAQLFFSFSLFRPIALLFGQSKYFVLVLDLCRLFNLQWDVKRYTHSSNLVVTKPQNNYLLFCVSSCFSKHCNSAGANSQQKTRRHESLLHWDHSEDHQAERRAAT